MAHTTIADVFAAIDGLPKDTPIEDALIEFRGALTQLANSNRIRGNGIFIKFSNHRDFKQIAVSARLDIAYEPARRYEAVLD